MQKAVQSTLDFGNKMKEIDEKAEACAMAYDLFKKLQIEGETAPGEIARAKADLQNRLARLDDELNRYLAIEYGKKLENKVEYEKWLKSHQPFHWFVEFYGIVHRKGGFDVIIGNPPYLEIHEVDYILRNFVCLECAAIHAMCIERGSRLLHDQGCMSMIVPLSLTSTQRMEIVQKTLEKNRNSWYANYAWRPAKLFDTVNRALTIFIITHCLTNHTFTTNYQKWTSENREGLFDRLNYVETSRKRQACWVPKLGEKIETNILSKFLSLKTSVSNFTAKSLNRIYYRTTGGLYWKVFTDFAPDFNINGKKGHSSRETWFSISESRYIKPIISVLSSGTFWYWYTISSNLRDLNPYDIQNFPVPQSVLDDNELVKLGQYYLLDIVRNSTMLVRIQKQTGIAETQSFKIQESKPIIDEIDRVLAEHYGFTEEELDYIINYDIKYRMGKMSEQDLGD